MENLRKPLHRLTWIRHSPATLPLSVLALSWGLVMSPVMAALTNPPVPIHGRAPTAIGALYLMMPGGVVALTDNALVSGTSKPNEFSVVPLFPGAAFMDADGDARGTPGLDVAPSGLVWTWKGPTGIALTATQLSQTFATNFAHNTVLTVQVTAPVIATSRTGIPTTSGTPTDFPSATYRVKVNIPAKPVIRVNGHTFAWDSGFPTTGFVGAKFQLYMNGVDATANSNYTYKENGNQTWVDIPTSNASGTEGAFTFTGTPTSANKTLKLIATNKTDSNDKHTLNITIGRWFVNGGATTIPAANADAYCTGLGGGYSTPPYVTMTNAAYGAVGVRSPSSGLWSQWGAMGTFGSGWVSNYYWALEPDGTNRHYVYFHNGNLNSNHPSLHYYVACSSAL